MYMENPKEFKLWERKDFFSYFLTIVQVKLQLMLHAVGYRWIVIAVFVEPENIDPLHLYG